MSGTGITAWIGALGPAVALILGIATFVLQRRFERRRDRRLAREAVQARAGVLEAVAASIAGDVRALGPEMHPNRPDKDTSWGAATASAAATLKSAEDTLAALDMGGIDAVPVWRTLMRLRARLGAAHYRVTSMHEACVEAFAQKRPVPLEVFRGAPSMFDRLATYATDLADAVAAAYPNRRA